MNRILALLRYYFTWTQGTRVMLWIGTVALVASAASIFLNRRLAFGFFIWAAMMYLHVPYVMASPALRKLLGSRRLSLVPGFALHAGLALLLFTALASAAIPLAAQVFSISSITPWLILRLFTALSLYSAVMQFLLTLGSRLTVPAFSILPPAGFLLVREYHAVLLPIFFNNQLTLILFALSLCGWAAALFLLTKKQDFKPLQLPDGTLSGQGWMMAGNQQAWPSEWLGAKLDKGASSQGTLVMGFPATFGMRLVNLFHIVVLSPLLSATMVHLITRGGNEMWQKSGFISLFILFSLSCAFFVSWTNGEIAARARLLWLRTSGSRRQLWHVVERQLWAGFAALLMIIGPILLLGLLFTDLAPSLLLHCLVLLLAGNCYNSYLNLCARLRQWSWLLQGVLMVASTGAMGWTVFNALRNDGMVYLTILELAMLLLAFAARELARGSFDRVDWMVLKPAMPGRRSAA